MKITSFIFNPIGIGLAFVHWLVVTFAVLGDTPSEFGLHQGTALYGYLVFIDFPAILIAGGLFQLSNFLIPGQSESIVLWLFFAVPIISLQWLLIGALVTAVIKELRNPDKSDPEKTLDLK